MTARVIALALAAGGLSACATPPGPAVGDPAAEAGEIFYNPVERERLPAGDRVTGLLAGAWSNADQYAFAPDDMKRPPAPGHPYDWIDLQHAEFHRVDAPRVGDHVVYLEWRAGAADGEISRQRIWAFREAEDGALSGMDFYTFADPGPYAGRGAQAGAFQDLTMAELIGYPEGCTLSAQPLEGSGYALEVAPEVCVITARSGRRMGIEARIEITPGRVTYREAGVLEDGSYAFLVPGGPAYRFEPVAPQSGSSSANKASSKSAPVVKAVQ